MAPTKIETFSVESIRTYAKEVRELSERLENICDSLEREGVEKFELKNVLMRVQGLRYVNKFCSELDIFLLDKKEENWKFSEGVREVD